MLVIWTALTKIYSHVSDSNFMLDVLSDLNAVQVQSLLSHGFRCLGSDLFLARGESMVRNCQLER
jgi:hypothetical protein